MHLGAVHLYRGEAREAFRVLSPLVEDAPASLELRTMLLAAEAGGTLFPPAGEGRPLKTLLPTTLPTAMSR